MKKTSTSVYTYQNIKEFIIACSQLGYRPKSPKIISFVAPKNFENDLPETIPFFIQHAGSRKKRNLSIPEVWDKRVFRWPFHISQGSFLEGGGNDLSFAEDVAYQGNLFKKESSWGIFWQANFDEFEKEGIFQIETEYGFSTPFEIADAIYTRFIRGYLNFIFCQRSGFEIPGVRKALNCDDGVLDYNGNQLPAAGGWNDAGDLRKWLSFTAFNIEALSAIIENSHETFYRQAVDEILWGNRFFHSMISSEGQVYEDAGGGKLREGEGYEQWWLENHPGVTATSDNSTDNIPDSGDERTIRSNYNPFVQFAFVRTQAIASRALKYADSSNCLVLANRAWVYGNQRGHDNRTLFVSSELLAACELYATGSPKVGLEIIHKLAVELLNRQFLSEDRIHGYFMEKDQDDAYRSIAFSCEPAWALLRFYELNFQGMEDTTERAYKAVKCYIENYLIEASNDNVFSFMPYGVYFNPPFPEHQSFRKIGEEKYIRSFIHVFAENQIPHGTSSVVMSQAYLLSRAARAFSNKKYSDYAERLIQWVTGHNTEGLSLFTGIGYKHPVAANFTNNKIPDAPVAGFMGFPDDTPYIETTNAIEWSTQEIWDVPFYYAVLATICIDNANLN